MLRHDRIQQRQCLKGVVLESLRSSDHTRALVVIKLVRDVTCSSSSQQISHDALGSFLGCFDNKVSTLLKEKYIRSVTYQESSSAGSGEYETAWS